MCTLSLGNLKYNVIPALFNSYFFLFFTKILVQSFHDQHQVVDTSIYAQQPLQYDRFQSSFPPTIHVHHNVVIQEENMEKVFVNVNNPHLVDDDHIEYDVTVFVFFLTSLKLISLVNIQFTGAWLLRSFSYCAKEI